VQDGAFTAGQQRHRLCVHRRIELPPSTTITVRARKDLLARKASWVFGGLVDGRRVQWNVAGWGNTQSAIQRGIPSSGRGGSRRHRNGPMVRPAARGPRPHGARLSGWHAAERSDVSRVDTVLAIAGRDDRTGDSSSRQLNTGPDAAAMTFDLSSAPRVAATGTLTVLSSPNPLDENSFRGAAKDRARHDHPQRLGAHVSHARYRRIRLSILRVQGR
jgi:hypothetical protein